MVLKRRRYSARRRVVRRRTGRTRYRRKFRRRSGRVMARPTWPIKYSSKIFLRQTGTTVLTGAGSHMNYFIPLNTLIIDWDVGNAKPWPTSLATEDVSHRFRSMIGIYNRFAVLGCKYRVTFANVMTNNMCRITSGTFGPGAVEPGAIPSYTNIRNYLVAKSDEELFQMNGLQRQYITGSNNTASSAIKTIKGYVSVRNKLKITSIQQDEHLHMTMPQIVSTGGYAIPSAQTSVPNEQHAVFLFIRIHNLTSVTPITFNKDASMTWYVRFWDRVRTEYDIINGDTEQLDRDMKARTLAINVDAEGNITGAEETDEEPEEFELME